jgi:hypothetical protein
MALKVRNSHQGMFVIPATIPFSCRRTSMNRETTTTIGPRLRKKPSALASRFSVTSTYLPYLSTSARPPNLPIAYPMLSPSTAPSHPKSSTRKMLSSPLAATRAPEIRMVSPGAGTPKSSRRIATKTIPYP